MVEPETGGDPGRQRSLRWIGCWTRSSADAETILVSNSRASEMDNRKDYFAISLDQVCCYYSLIMLSISGCTVCCSPIHIFWNVTDTLSFCFTRLLSSRSRDFLVANLTKLSLGSLRFRFLKTVSSCTLHCSSSSSNQALRRLLRSKK